MNVEAQTKEEHAEMGDSNEQKFAGTDGSAPKVQKMNPGSDVEVAAAVLHISSIAEKATESKAMDAEPGYPGIRQIHDELWTTDPGDIDPGVRHMIAMEVEAHTKEEHGETAETKEQQVAGTDASAPKVQDMDPRSDLQMETKEEHAETAETKQQHVAGTDGKALKKNIDPGSEEGIEAAMHNLWPMEKKELLRLSEVDGRMNMLRDAWEQRPDGMTVEEFKGQDPLWSKPLRLWTSQKMNSFQRKSLHSWAEQQAVNSDTVAMPIQPRMKNPHGKPKKVMMFWPDISDEEWEHFKVNIQNTAG